LKSRLAAFLYSTNKIYTISIPIYIYIYFLIAFERVHSGFIYIYITRKKLEIEKDYSVIDGTQKTHKFFNLSLDRNSKLSFV
jgi:hypothetical protein